MEDSEDGDKMIRRKDPEDNEEDHILLVEPDEKYLETAREQIKENGNSIRISTAKNYGDARYKYEEGVDGIISALYYPSGMDGKRTSFAGKRLRELLEPKIEKIDQYQETNEENDYFSNSEYLGGEDSQQEAQQETLPLDAKTYRLYFEDWMRPIENIGEEENYQPFEANMPPMSLLLADYVQQDNEFEEVPFVVCADRYRKGAKTYPVIETMKEILGQDFDIEAPYKHLDLKEHPINVYPGKPEPVADYKKFGEAYDLLAKDIVNS